MARKVKEQLDVSDDGLLFDFDLSGTTEFDLVLEDDNEMFQLDLDEDEDDE